MLKTPNLADFWNKSLEFCEWWDYWSDFLPVKCIEIQLTHLQGVRNFCGRIRKHLKNEIWQKTTGRQPQPRDGRHGTVRSLRPDNADTCCASYLKTQKLSACGGSDMRKLLRSNFPHNGPSDNPVVMGWISVRTWYGDGRAESAHQRKQKREDTISTWKTPTICGNLHCYCGASSGLFSYFPFFAPCSRFLSHSL